MKIQGNTIRELSISSSSAVSDIGGGGVSTIDDDGANSSKNAENGDVLGILTKSASTPDFKGLAETAIRRTKNTLFKMKQ